MIIKKNLQNVEEKINKNEIEQSIILNNKLQIEIKKIWNKNDIKLINAFFEILEKQFDENKKDEENVFKSIMCFLKEKDFKIKKYLNKYSTEL